MQNATQNAAVTHTEAVSSVRSVISNYVYDRNKSGWLGVIHTAPSPATPSSNANLFIWQGNDNPQRITLEVYGNYIQVTFVQLPHDQTHYANTNCDFAHAWWFDLTLGLDHQEWQGCLDLFAQELAALTA